MGYYVTIDLCDTRIKKSNEEAALNALKAYDKDTGFDGWCGDIDEEETCLENALGELRYLAEEQEIDGEKYIVFIEFQGEKLGDEEAIFTVLAPYMEECSKIYFDGEDDCEWRYTFKDGNLIDDSIEKVWPEDKGKIFRIISKSNTYGGIVVAANEEAARVMVDECVKQHTIPCQLDYEYRLKEWNRKEDGKTNSVLLWT